MLFSSNIFLFLFLPLALVSNFLFTKSIAQRNFILLIFSLIFYSFGEIDYLWLLLLSLTCNYFFGILIDKNLLRNNSNKIIIFLAISFNLLLLTYFKYFNFILENFYKIFHLEYHPKSIALPLGISFFTFHAISYLIDIYRKKTKVQKNFYSLMLYICFFPQLIAGPIVRYNFIAKYLTKRNIHQKAIAFGIRLFLIGLTKKVIIANPIGEVADAVFGAETEDLNRFLTICGIVCYSFQIYFDFSGYSDMALGLARIFGFKFPPNFNYPYIALSIKDFWRRWHISLSTWFRDYVYIPLGGNRVSIYRQYFNLILVFFLCGLWHGASWNFVIWGLFHGVFLVLERLSFFHKFHKSLPKIIQNFYMLMIIMIGWIFFRGYSLEHSLELIRILIFDGHVVNLPGNIVRLLNSHYFLMSIALAILGYSGLIKKMADKIIKKYKFSIFIVDLFLLASFVLVIIRLSAQTHNPFIYFQF
jgi:alginate O-acetyltransferase complex protein AlgI